MGAAANRLHGLARWLVCFGHDVTVITGFPNYPSGVIPEAYQRRRQVEETLDGVRVIRTWVYASPKRGALRRLANYFSYVLSAIGAGVQLPKGYDVLMASSPPLFIGLAGWILSAFHRIPWTFDIRDIWPELAVEAGEFAPTSAIVRWGERLERFLYRSAQHITVVTEAKRQKLLVKNVPPHKLGVVPNGVDLDWLQQHLDGVSATADLGLNDKFIVIYAGLIGVFQHLDIAIDAAVALRTHPKIHFLIVGEGVKRVELEERVTQEKLSNVTFLPPQPREAIPSLLKSSQVSLVPLVNAQLVDAVPTKMLEAWGCERPVLLVASGEAKRLVDESGGGVVIAPGDAQQLAAAILELYRNQTKLGEYAQRGYDYVLQFDRPQLARQMEAVLQHVVDGQQKE